MFLFKKIVAPLIFPLPFCMMLLLVGILLLWLSRRQRLGKLVTTIGAASLLLLSYGPVPNALLKRLEQQYTPLYLTVQPEANVSESLAAVKWIVVLGGGHSSDAKVSAVSNLYSGTLFRLIEAVELHRKLPGTKLLLSGSDVWRSESEAAAMAKVAEGLGVDSQNIVLDEKSNDTEEQARFIKPIIGDDPAILVTSASHMPRAMALFRKAGMNPLPAPTDYKAVDAEAMPRDYYPSPANLQKSEWVMYEGLGSLWAKLRGKS